MAMEFNDNWSLVAMSLVPLEPYGYEFNYNWSLVAIESNYHWSLMDVGLTTTGALWL